MSARRGRDLAVDWAVAAPRGPALLDEQLSCSTDNPPAGTAERPVTVAASRLDREPDASAGSPAAAGAG